MTSLLRKALRHNIQNSWFDIIVNAFSRKEELVIDSNPVIQRRSDSSDLFIYLSYFQIKNKQNLIYHPEQLRLTLS